MTHYQIITDEPKLDQFINFLPELNKQEAYYLCLFGRHKYCPTFPNTRDSGQLARIIARNKQELKEKIRRLETPLGSYSRDGIIAPQESLAAYIALNPRSLIKANKALLMELAKRFADNQTDFNPITLATTEIHRAVDRKFFVDFDFDDANPNEYLPQIKEALPEPSMYKVLYTRGGFHLLVVLSEIKKLKNNWHQKISQLPKCDVKGSNTLTPIPGCTQGGFTPHFME